MEISDLVTGLAKGSRNLLNNIKKIVKEIESYKTAKYILEKDEVKVKRSLKRTIRIPVNITSDSSTFYDLLKETKEQKGPSLEIPGFQKVENLTFKLNSFNPFEKMKKLGEPYALLIKNGNQYHYYVKGK